MNGVLLNMVKKSFLPMVREQGGPALEKYLTMLFDRYGARLEEGEDHVSVVIERSRKSGDVLFAVCAMSADNRAVRVLQMLPLDGLLDVVVRAMEGDGDL